jgi:hypothetical protein
MLEREHPMVDPPELSEREHKELTTLYQVTVSDLAFFKSQQWTLTNYALLAFGAVAAIPHIPQVQTGRCSKVVLCAIATVVYLSADWLLWRLKESIEVRQKRLERIFPKFTKTFRDTRGDKKQVSATEVFIFIAIVLTFGIGLVWWILLCG